ncbi:gluconokinase [Bradyrhizobium sp. SYSU BS000235]|uniref:gluconokinase n=1 Tax=Bradyrhizobium sp. SYSU BS000235 TaxID=3411332 RepID=UPI003C77B037
MQAPTKISAIIVMGVSGSGKSTIAAALAKHIGFACEDGDSYHPASNVAKMHAGTPLTDEDRWPWLQAIADDIDRRAATGRPFVVSCSALKRAYRDVLVHGRPDVRLVYLKGTRDLIAERLTLRKGHFMPASLLDSQFATIEEPTVDENVVVVDIDAPVDRIVATIADRLRMSPEPGSLAS